eukprot:246421-Rhodomonas_salina.1
MAGATLSTAAQHSSAEYGDPSGFGARSAAMITATSASRLWMLIAAADTWPEEASTMKRLKSGAERAASPGMTPTAPSL